MIQLPFEDKVDVFSLHSVANISGNMLAIIHNVSHWVPLGVTRYMVSFSFSPSSFDCPLSVFSSGCVLKWHCVLYMRMMSRSHMASNVFSEFLPPLYVMWSALFSICLFSSTWVLTRLCQWVSVRFRWSFKSLRVTLHLVWETREVSWTSCRCFWLCGGRGSSALLFPFALSNHSIADWLLKSVTPVKVFVGWTTLLDLFHDLCSVYAQSLGDIEMCWAGGAQVDSDFLFCFSIRKPYRFGENSQTSVLVTNFLKSHVCYWC